MNLKEIAKELNVSRATIDRVIHNRGGIGKETVIKVNEFLTKVNYQPNKVGKSLAKRLQKSIYVILPDSENEFFIDIEKRYSDRGGGDPGLRIYRKHP